MPYFLTQFAEDIAKKRRRFAAIFDSKPHNPCEEELRGALSERWHPLPDGLPAARPTWAVDGGSGSTPLSNGASFISCRAVLVGPDYEDSRVICEVLRGSDPADPGRATDRLRMFLELSLAVDNLPGMAGGMLLLDGTLLSQLSHALYLRPMPIGDFPDLRISIIEALFNLFEGCRRHNGLLAGISKSARATILSRSLADGSQPLLCDAELLARFTEGAGFTEPVLFGTDGIDADRPQAETDDLRVLYRERIGDLPAIGVFFVRFAPGDDPLRIDTLGNTLGCTDPLLSFSRRWAGEQSADEILSALLAQYGGSSVYNSMLYAADRVVRLSRGALANEHLGILRDIIGTSVSMDRGARRFAPDGE